MRAGKTLFLLLVVVFALLTYVLNILTGGLVFKYLKSSKNPMEKANQLGVQFGISFLAAFIIPNNVLVEFNFFNELFKSNDLWIPVIMLTILSTFIVLFGILFSIGSKEN